MSRIFPKPLSDYPWYVRLFFRAQIKKYGAISDPLLLWGRIPKALMGFLWMQKALNRKRSPLSPLLRAHVMTKISQLNKCAFCSHMNASCAIQRGGSEEKIAALESFRESALFSEQEKAALEYAEAMTSSSDKISDVLFQRLRNYYNEDAIVELTTLIALQILSSKFNAALEADPFRPKDQGS